MPRVIESKSKPVLVTFSILAAIQAVLAANALTGVISAGTLGLIGLLVAAAQTGLTFFVHNQVTPWQDVVAKLLPTGVVVNGPASGKGVGSTRDEGTTDEYKPQ